LPMPGKFAPRCIKPEIKLTVNVGQSCTTQRFIMTLLCSIPIGSRKRTNQTSHQIRNCIHSALGEGTGDFQYYSSMVCSRYPTRICPGRYLALDSAWTLIACISATCDISKSDTDLKKNIDLMDDFIDGGLV